MTAFHKDTALFCIFHNQNRYLDDGNPCSHIYSGIVQEENGVLDMTIQDFDGRSRTIDTDLSGKQFNLAAMVPISRQSASSIQHMVGQLNQLEALNKWPFYFSIDMALSYKHEVNGAVAKAPEGHIDPPLNNQNPHLYEGTGTRLLTRINCVRMALMNAQMAGVKISNIADINPLSQTGEEVRDLILGTRRRMLSGGRGTEGHMFQDSFVAKKKGKDKSEASFVLGTDGLCIVQTEKKDFRMGGFCDALAHPVQGKSLFNWVSKGRKEKFQQAPLTVPSYLQHALSFI